MNCYDDDCHADCYMVLWSWEHGLNGEFWENELLQNVFHIIKPKLLNVFVAISLRWGHPFSTYAKFSEKLIFLNP